MPASYANLLATYKQNAMGDLPQANKLLAAGQQARGIYNSPIANYGLTDLYNKYLQGVNMTGANLGLKAADAELQNNQFNTGLQFNGEQNALERANKEKLQAEDFANQLDLAKQYGKAQTNQMWTKLPFDLLSAYLVGR